MTKDVLVIKIYKDLESNIINGVFKIGNKLPSERELSEKYKTNRIIIREAIAMLIKSGLVETHPQRGTFIRDFQEEVTLDTLINLIKVSNTIDIDILKSTIQFIINNDIVITGRAAKTITAEQLKNIETLILKKRLNDDLQILAECDTAIFHETVKATLDPIAIVLSITLKPLRVMILKIVYSMFENKTSVINNIIENDIKLFKAFTSHDSEKAMDALKEKIADFENLVMKINRIEDGKIYINKSDGVSEIEVEV